MFVTYRPAIAGERWCRQDFEREGGGHGVRLHKIWQKSHKVLHKHNKSSANSDIDTGYTNVVAVALAKTAANYFVILIFLCELAQMC